jgi:spermidine synthase
MEYWLNERHTDGYSVNWKIKDILYTEQTEYQHLSIVDTVEFGKALVLDGIIQCTEKDDFIYHEMIVHPALMVHPNPKKILVIGGGDGGSVREVVKHSSVMQVDLAEIDDKVIWASRKYLPKISNALNHEKTRIFIEDGLQFVKKKNNYYDIVIVDSSDPVGQAVGLYSREFYKDIYSALKMDGIMIAQTESPIFNDLLLSEVYKSIAGLYPITKVYLTAVASYIGGFWSFTIGSKEYDPICKDLSNSRLASMELNYYNEQIHRACFVLPNFVQKLLR